MCSLIGTLVSLCGHVVYVPIPYTGDTNTRNNEQPIQMIVFFYYLDAQILYFNTFTTLLYMFRALLCSSSGGQLYQYSIWYRKSL